MTRYLVLTAALGLTVSTLESRLSAASTSEAARPAASASRQSVPSSARDATTNEEKQLIGVLRSDRSPKEKDAACGRLKRIGTARSVPALSTLLCDEQLSHSARYALESMPSAKAGRALADALVKTSGPTRLGIIQSLAFRREARAVPTLTALLVDPDPALATAAATALGRIGGSKALKALQAASAPPLGPAAPTGSVHNAIADATLRCAADLLNSGSLSKALAVFQRLYGTEKADHLRVAAYRGMILSSRRQALPLMITAITGTEGTSQTAALQLVGKVQAPNAALTLAQLLPKVPAITQVALIGGLSQRSDPAAAPAIAVLVNSSTPEVRLAAISALGLLGDASLVPLLAQSAASATGAEQEAARLSLVQLRRGDPARTLLAQLPGAKPAVQAELARALGDRRDRLAVPTLMELARKGSDSARKAALQALPALVEQPQIGSLVRLVFQAKTEAARAEAAEALGSACHNIQSRHGQVNLDPLLQGLATGSTQVRIALLPICSGLIDSQVRSALRTAVADSNPPVRDAGIRALCDTGDAELLPDLLKVACEAREETFRTLAIRACVRLTTQEETVKLSNAQRLELLKTIFATPLNAGQKRLVLAGFAGIPELQALQLVEPLLDEAAVQVEAAQAAIKIASALPYAQTDVAIAALKKVLTTTTDSPSREAAEKALKELEAGTDHITAWQVAGPFRQEGKDYAALFDIVFPPETNGTPGVKWQSPASGTDPKRPWVVDLLKTFGGEQCVAYARTRVHSSQARPARLELGSDDGIKVWLNGSLVHTNNTFRALQPASDKVNVTLDPGWNQLLLKITQLNQGWAFCARFLTPDGRHLEGLEFDARPEATQRTRTNGIGNTPQKQ